nr:uncharacterized protein LOC125965716 [Syngnathus scovelli]
MADTPVQPCMDIRDSAFGLADWSGDSPLYEGGLEGVFRLQGITLLSLSGKIYSGVLERRVRREVKPQIQEEQCGFRPGCGTVDQLYTLGRILEGAWEFAQPVHMFCGPGEGVRPCPSGGSVEGPSGVRGAEPTDKGGSVPVSPMPKFGPHFRQLVGFVPNEAWTPPRLPFVTDYVHNFYGQNFADSMVLLASSGRDLQLSLERFTAECEVVSTSKSESMVLGRKRVECPLRIRDEILPQVEEYLGVLFASEGRMEREIDRRIGAASAIMRTLYRSVVVKRELSQKAKLSIYRSIYAPTLTYGHELWVVTERTRSRIQVAERSFLRRMSGLSLRDRVGSSVIRERLGVESLLLHVERSQIRRLGHLIRMPPGRLPGEVFRACPTGRRPRGRPRTHWRDYVSQLAWERLGIPRDELGEVAGEREVWESVLKLLPP